MPMQRSHHPDANIIGPVMFGDDQWRSSLPVIRQRRADGRIVELPAAILV
jgi:hypothetical protein